MGYVFGDWIEHDGKGMPVSADTFVLCRFRDGVEESEFDFYEANEDMAGYWGSSKTSNCCWTFGDDADNRRSEIVAYRIGSPK